MFGTTASQAFRSVSGDGWDIAIFVSASATVNKEKYGYMGLFVIISAWGIVALVATLLYPKNPSPLRMKNKQAAESSCQGKAKKLEKTVFPPPSDSDTKDLSKQSSIERGRKEQFKTFDIFLSL